MLAAIATAVVEAPLELFRHNAQAGTGALGGNFFGAMLAVVRQAGSPLPLYRGLTGARARAPRPAPARRAGAAHRRSRRPERARRGCCPMRLAAHLPCAGAPKTPRPPSTTPPPPPTPTHSHPPTAYSLEAIPYDVSELAVVGNLNDGRAAAEAAAASGGGGPGGPLSALALAAPQPVWDVGVGAVAGAAAVIASMPFDVVKTYMQVNPSCGDGLAGFAATARHLVAKGGPGALWLGLAPRLAHQVGRGLRSSVALGPVQPRWPWRALAAAAEPAHPPNHTLTHTVTQYTHTHTHTHTRGPHRSPARASAGGPYTRRTAT